MRVSPVLVAALVLASAAGAQTMPQSQMTEAEMIAAGDFGAFTETDAVEEEAGGGCRTHTKKRKAEGPFPFYVDLFAYFQRVRWCYTGTPTVPGKGRLTSVSRGRWAEVYYFWWDFVGHIDAWGWGGAGDWNAVRGTQGKFKYCPPKTGCIQTKTPWIQHEVFGNGRYGVQSGGT